MLDDMQFDDLVDLLDATEQLGVVLDGLDPDEVFPIQAP